MTSTDTILQLSRTTDCGLVRSPEWFRELVSAVNDLLVHDFNGLVQILYRLDVSETKIREALVQSPGTDAADLIAKLLLERQIQKIESRKSFRPPPAGDDDNERW
jgi:hypothetical protein